MIDDFDNPPEQRSSSLACAPAIVNALPHLICAAARDGMSRGTGFPWSLDFFIARGAK
jgi:hypothetical protein